MLLILTISPLLGEEVDDITALYYLIQAPKTLVQKKLNAVKENKTPSFYRAMLYLNLCMRDWNESYANSGHRDLEKIRSFPTNPNLLKVYKGISHSFQGKIKTLFGMDDLEKASLYMKEIPLDESDWVIRFLRGITLIELGRGLPDFFFFDEAKKEAVSIGTADLLYVRRSYKKNGTLFFNLSAYDRKKKPVPLEIYHYIDGLRINGLY